MERTNCRACLSEDLELLMDLGPQPLAGGFLPPEADAVAREKVYPLPIHVCRRCGLIQTSHVIPPEILFTNYCFSSSTIDPLIEHFGAYAQWLKERYAPELLLEFGCNDGILLEPLEKLGVSTCGVDISENITEMARERGLNVITGFFDQACASEVADDFGRVDIVTGSNCFPHNDDPDEIILAAKKVLKPNGHFCVEVMYAGDLLTSLQWDSMYHEHLSYYCVQTLEVLFKRFGMHIVDVEHLPMHAGSLRAVAAVDPDEKPRPCVAEMIAQENQLGLVEVETWRGFAKKVQRKIEVVGSVFDKLKGGSRIWGYGAAGRATMWVNACKMDYLEAMVDSSPLRSGRLMPGTHTPIVFPEALRLNPPDYIFVPAWNYIDVIMAKEEWFQGIWAVPLPNLKFL